MLANLNLISKPINVWEKPTQVEKKTACVTVDP